MECGEFMMVMSTNSHLIHHYRRIALGEWLGPFAFFISYLVKKWVKYLSTQKSGKKNLGTVSW